MGFFVFSPLLDKWTFGHNARGIVSALLRVLQLFSISRLFASNVASCASLTLNLTTLVFRYIAQQRGELIGYIPSELIQRAGLHMLSILRVVNLIRYSRFYDGSDKTADLLCQALGLDDDWHSAELLMDIAAEQLSNAGIVTLTSLPDRLADEEYDYAITLNEKGKTFLRSRKAFHFYDVDV